MSKVLHAGDERFLSRKTNVGIGVIGEVLVRDAFRCGHDWLGLIA